MTIDKIDLEIIGRAGYKKHPRGNGFIKPHGRSRFHILEADGKYDLHFDKTRNKTHYSHGCHDVVVGEVRRILKIERK